MRRPTGITIFARRFRKTVAITAFVLLGSAGIALVINNFFSIRTIEVVGTNLAVRVDERKIPKNLLFFPTEKVRGEILGDNTMLRDVRIKKKFPGTLVFVAVGRIPIVRLVSGGREVTLDNEDIAIGIAGPSDNLLPVLSIPLPSVQLGQKVTDQRVTSAVEFIDRMGQQKVTSIRQVESAWLLAKVEETDIYFTQGSDISGKVNTLQTIIAGFRIKGTLPKVIDLRFDKPIVTF